MIVDIVVQTFFLVIIASVVGVILVSWLNTRVAEDTDAPYSERIEHLREVVQPSPPLRLVVNELAKANQAQAEIGDSAAAETGVEEAAKEQDADSEDLTEDTAEIIKNDDSSKDAMLSSLQTACEDISFSLVAND